MEAHSITPAKANPQPARPHVPGELGEIFQTLLRESALRIEARGELPPQAAPRAFEALRDAPASERTHRPSPARAAREAADPEPSVEPNRRDRDADGVEAAPDDRAEAPEAPAAAESSPARPAPDRDGEGTRETTEETTDAPVQGAGEHGEPAPLAPGMFAANGLPAPTSGIPDAATARTDVPGLAGPVDQTRPRPAAQSQPTPPNAPQAMAATAAGPAATLGTGTMGRAAQVEVAPAPLFAPPNASLGGGAAVAAMAAGPGADDAATQGPGARNGGAVPAGRSAAVPSMPTGASAPAQPGAGAAVPAQAEIAPAQNATSPAAQAAAGQPIAAPNAAPDTGEAAAPAPNPPTGPGTAGDGREQAPRTAQTTMTEASNGQVRDPAMPSGPAGDPRRSDAPAPSVLARAAQPQGGEPRTARTTDAPMPSVPVQSGPAPEPGAQKAQPPAAQATTSAHAPDGAARSGTTHPASSADPAASAPQGAGSDASASARPSAVPAERATPATPARGTAPAGPSNANLPGAPAVGLMQAATRVPAGLPAHARPAAAQPVPIDQVAVHIQRAAASGDDRIRIRLHPAELGQIDVKLKVGHDGMVKAVVAVDRVETFDLLQRDARGLERALQDAGLKTDSGSLSFHLRGEGHGGFQAGHEAPDRAHGAREAPGTNEAPVDAQPEPGPATSERALDISV